ncbi:MAG: tRNA (guanosine(46)-N7)-methyltransferase TrmB [Bacteroidales bacterium]|nr:tRNA (guanosine(46)-N7)-methyltransferase TrmB [Bacteroidales bacterium]
MGKNKLTKFAETYTFPNFVQPAREEVLSSGFNLKGRWHTFFKNKHPIVLELGCGRGEYTIGMANMFADKNFIGIDRKGARMWKGSKEAIEKKMDNVAFLRAQIDMLNHYFDAGEIDEIWITFPDPQPKKVNKRMTCQKYLNLYSLFLKKNGTVNLKTDSRMLYDFTLETIQTSQYTLIQNISDIYALSSVPDILKIQTYYEKMWLEQGYRIQYIQFLLHP